MPGSAADHQAGPAVRREPDLAVQVERDPGAAGRALLPAAEPVCLGRADRLLAIGDADRRHVRELPASEVGVEEVPVSAKVAGPTVLVGHLPEGQAEVLVLAGEVREPAVEVLPAVLQDVREEQAGIPDVHGGEQAEVQGHDGLGGAGAASGEEAVHERDGVVRLPDNAAEGRDGTGVGREWFRAS